MIIRKANIEKDALSIIEGAKDFAKRMDMGKLISGDEDFTDAVIKIVSSDGVEVFVAEHESKVVGSLGIAYIPYLWNPSIIIAEELFWWSAEDSPMKTGYKLLCKAMEEIEENNAIPVFTSLVTSHKGVEKMYLKFGLTPIETRFARL